MGIKDALAVEQNNKVSKITNVYIVYDWMLSEEILLIISIQQLFIWSN